MRFDRERSSIEDEDIEERKADKGVLS